MPIILIAAMTKNRVIGKNNALPWNIPEELQHFRTKTLDSTVIMGRKTYDSIGRLMPKRHNIIISRSSPNIPGADVCPSLDEAIKKAKTYNKTIFIIGGAQIFKEALPIADKMYLSFIKKDYDGDTYFPEFDKSEWTIEKREDHEEFEFIIYTR
jgi:dihydrofolate reductase